MNGKKFRRYWNSECSSYLTFVVDTFNRNGFNNFNVKSVTSVCCNNPWFSFNNIGLFDFIIPLPMAITIRRFIAVPAAHVAILTFAIRPSKSRFGRPFCLKIVFPSLSFLILNFQWLMDVLRKVYFGWILLKRSSAA